MQEFHHRFRPGVDVKFFINRPHVVTHGVGADAHVLGDSLIDVTFGQELQELAFAGAEMRPVRLTLGLGKN